MTHAILSEMEKAGWKRSFRPLNGSHTLTKGDASLSLILFTHKVELSLLSVNEASRRRGIATQALEELTRAADETNTLLVIHVFAMNPKSVSNSVLIPFYEKSGFKRLGGEINGYQTMSRRPSPAHDVEPPVF